MRRRTLTVALVLVALASTGPLAGCSSDAQAAPNGVASMSAGDALSTSLAAARAQTSLRVVSKTVQNGIPFIVDMRLRNGGGASGTVRVGAEELQLVSSGTDLFIKADETYWKSQMDPRAARGIGTMWVRVPQTTTTFAQFAALTDYAKVLDSLLQPAGPTTLGATSTILQQPAVQIASTTGSIWVAADGVPLPVQVDNGAVGGVARFGEWGAPVPIAVPAAKDTVDLGALGVS